MEYIKTGGGIQLGIRGSWFVVRGSCKNKQQPVRTGCWSLVDSARMAYAFFAISTICLNPSGSWIAISLSILRLIVTLALMRPAMNAL